MENLKRVRDSVKETLESKKHLKILVIVGLIFFGIFIAFPVFSIPGNGLLFQLGVFSAFGYFVMIVFALLMGLMVAMRVYKYDLTKSGGKAGKGFIGGFFGFIGGIFGTAGCPACVAAIFGFLGSGATLFLVKNQWYVVGISFLLLIISIYMTSLEIKDGCSNCC
ncbi:MAG: hypothetical protein ABEI74_04285 [Candidatus Pacearchaeota archaeon]